MTKQGTVVKVIPLSRRPIDFLFILFFVVNLFFITYIVDFEQLAIPQVIGTKWEYPVWPPKWGVDLVHWFSRNYDPLILARPVWWKVTIWWDSLFFGPFYLFAIYAFVKGKDWIRTPSLVYSSAIITIVCIILSEELWGPHATHRRDIVLLANAPWLLMPLWLLVRMWLNPHPFTERVKQKKS